MRQIESDKLKLILELKSNPIVLIACKKQSLAPSTFYRWKYSDKRFAKEVNRAINRGRETVSDMAEVHLVNSVKKGEMRSVFYWLKVFRHPYKRIDKTTIEIKQKASIEAPAKKPNQNIERIIAKIGDKFLRDHHRESLLIHELIQKGCTEEDIKKLLKDHPEYKSPTRQKRA
jgi:hypothetical protein